jgi:hypothetical protein
VEKQQNHHSLSQTWSSSFGSETLACDAMNPFHPLQNWIAEMMVPARWCGSDERLRCLSPQWRNTKSVLAELVSDMEQHIWF